MTSPGTTPAAGTGLVFRPENRPEALRRLVVDADAAGIEELWLWEDCFLEGGLTSAAAALAWTERIRVGIGLLPVPLRNPAVTAMEIATLVRMFPSRFMPVLGHGVQDWMRQVGAGVDSPLTLLREHVTAVQALLRGETVTVHGTYVSLDAVTLDWVPSRPPPLLVGARGPRTIELAAELADGVLLDAVADAAAVRAARAILGPAKQLTVYTEVTPGISGAGLDDRVAELAAAGADTVVVQGTAQDTGEAALIAALTSGR